MKSGRSIPMVHPEKMGGQVGCRRVGGQAGAWQTSVPASRCVPMPLPPETVSI